MKLTSGFYKILNVFMAKPQLWSSLSDVSGPKGAFNNCPLNFRSHLTGYLFISIVEREELDASQHPSHGQSGACCRILFPLPLQNQRDLIAERELGCDSTISEAQSMYSQVLSQLGEADTETAWDTGEYQEEGQNEALGEPEWRAVHSVQWVEEDVKTSELSLERKAQVQSTENT